MCPNKYWFFFLYTIQIATLLMKVIQWKESVVRCISNPHLQGRATNRLSRADPFSARGMLCDLLPNPGNTRFFFFFSNSFWASFNERQPAGQVEEDEEKEKNAQLPRTQEQLSWCMASQMKRKIKKKYPWCVVHATLLEETAHILVADHAVGTRKTIEPSLLYIQHREKAN